MIGSEVISEFLINSEESKVVIVLLPFYMSISKSKMEQIF